MIVEFSSRRGRHKSSLKPNDRQRAKASSLATFVLIALFDLDTSTGVGFNHRTLHEPKQDHHDPPRQLSGYYGEIGLSSRMRTLLGFVFLTMSLAGSYSADQLPKPSKELNDLI